MTVGRGQSRPQATDHYARTQQLDSPSLPPTDGRHGYAFGSQQQDKSEGRDVGCDRIGGTDRTGM